MSEQSRTVLACLPDASWVEDVGPIDGFEFVVSDLCSLPPRSDEIEVCVPPYTTAFDKTYLAQLPNLRHVQLLTAGYDGIPEVLPETITLANAVGVHDTSTAELAVTLALAPLRSIPEFVRNAETGTWAAPRFYDALADRRALILGYGSIGRAIARRLLPFEVAVTAVASRPREGDELVGTVHGISDLPGLLPTTDVLIVVVPLNDATSHLVDDEVLSALPDGAVVVNVARGGVIDTEAILRHVGRLRFALDVTDPEPLPPDHLLWQAPGVLISPHTGGPTTAFRPRAARYLSNQLRAYLSAEPVPNIVHGPGMR